MRCDQMPDPPLRLDLLLPARCGNSGRDGGGVRGGRGRNNPPLKMSLNHKLNLSLGDDLQAVLETLRARHEYRNHADLLRCLIRKAVTAGAGDHAAARKWANLPWPQQDALDADLLASLVPATEAEERARVARAAGNEGLAREWEQRADRARRASTNQTTKTS